MEDSEFSLVDERLPHMTYGEIDIEEHAALVVMVVDVKSEKACLPPIKSKT